MVGWSRCPSTVVLWMGPTRPQHKNQNHDFDDFGVSFTVTVAGRHTRRGGPRRSVQRRGEPLIVLTRGPLYLPCNAAPQ